VLSSLGRRELRCSKRLPIALADDSYEVAANALNMHPKYVLPLFHRQTLLGSVFRYLASCLAGNDEGFGVDAAAQDVHGCCGVGAVCA
jgi:hypothetical protein